MLLRFYNKHVRSFLFLPETNLTDAYYYLADFLNDEAK